MSYLKVRFKQLACGRFYPSFVSPTPFSLLSVLLYYCKPPSPLSDQRNVTKRNAKQAQQSAIQVVRLHFYMV